MESLESDMGFDLPSSLKFDTFSMISTPITENQNETVPRKLIEKIGRGLGDIQSKRNQFIVNGTYRNSEDWISQIEYDRFMNEVWVGIVLTLIVISLVFCICSCFLYHQFRQWKRNYHRNIRRSVDIESVKLSVGDDDSLPDYTLVSGLPSYDAALEQLKKSPEKCLLVQTSIYEVFPISEKQPSSSANGQYLQHNTNQQKEQSSFPKTSLTEEDGKLEVSVKVPSYAEALVESR